MTQSQTVRAAVVAVVVFALLAGCGPMPGSTPTAAPDTTRAPVVTTAAPGTPAAQELTLGDLAQRVGAAWPAVHSYRVTFTGATTGTSAALGTPQARPPATPGATPVAEPGATPVSRSRET